MPRTSRSSASQLALGHEVGPLTVERVEFVGARVGSDLRRAALASLGVASLLILDLHRLPLQLALRARAP